MELSRLDFPTLERPAKATSRSVGGGREASSTAPATNSAFAMRVSSAAGFIGLGLVRLAGFVPPAAAKTLGVALASAASQPAPEGPHDLLQLGRTHPPRRQEEDRGEHEHPRN